MSKGVLLQYMSSLSKRFPACRTSNSEANGNYT